MVKLNSAFWTGALLGAGILITVVSSAWAAVQEETRLSLGDVENFTDQINLLTRSIEEQKLKLEQARNELELLEAEGEDPESADLKALAREELQGQIRDLEKAYQENEKQLETYSARIQESHGYAPQLLGSSAISKTSEK